MGTATPTVAIATIARLLTLIFIILNNKLEMP
jgi:hypothetical protein